MAKKAAYVVPYRRKREGKTDYKTRLNLLKSGMARFVIRPSNKHIITQLVKYETDGDKIIASAHSKELESFGWTQNTGNIPAAYLTGFLCGQKAKESGINDAIVDISLLPSIAGSRLYSAIKGAIDSGLQIPADETVFPDPKRIEGNHIKDMGNKTITDEFSKVKQKIEESSKK